MSLNLPDVKIKIGFEIHQQLDTKKKLFCDCYCVDANNLDSTFIRKLRPTQSELGFFDSTTIFESKKNRLIKYHFSPNSSCLVEADEEPPHDINSDALEIGLIISLALHSTIVDEIHVMRKIVIDGSNTSGFQRTMLIATGGYIEVNDNKIGIQTISLEEDASKIISDDGVFREYSLDRLGVPLIEIAVEPVTVSGKIEEIIKIATTIGQLLRASKRVSRGLGSIRQDVNISINDGNVVEVKGVQQLDQLFTMIKYEIFRQHGLMLISEKLKTIQKTHEIAIGSKIIDVHDIMNNSKSKVIKKIITSSDDCIFKAIRIDGFGGLLGFEPYPGIRLGKELGELVRFYGIGGIFHSDELPNYGITLQEVQMVRKRLDIITDEINAFILVGGPSEILDYVINAICERLSYALIGVPYETRAITVEGKTVFSRPRAGSARMYPETDIPPFQISPLLLESLYTKIPKTWNDIILSITQKYKINIQLAEQIFDSRYYQIFEKISDSTSIPPSFVASKLVEDITNLERQGFDSKLLTIDMIEDVFSRLELNEIAKESIPLIFEKIMKNDVAGVEDAIVVLGLKSLTETELNEVIDSIIEEYSDIIKSKGRDSFSLLMGRSMSKLRGKVDGQKVNNIIKHKLEQLVHNRSK